MKALIAILLAASAFVFTGGNEQIQSRRDVVINGSCSNDTLPYSLNLIASVSNQFPGDVYFSNHVAAPTPTSGARRLYIRRGGTIRVANVSVIAQATVGSAESWSLYIRVNGSTDHLISRLSVSTAQRIFYNDTMNVPVSRGDYIEIRSKNPTWTTNPTNVIFGGYVIVDE